MSGWIQHFGLPTNITSHRGRQFESGLWKELLNAFGIQHTETTAYHPQANGMVERFHRQLKSALRARLTSDRWAEQLPVVMLGIRSAIKEDLGCSAAQLVFGAAPRLPKCLALPTISAAVEPYLRQLQTVARNLQFTPPDWHGNTAAHVSEKLAQTNFVNVERLNIHPTLEPQYAGPFRVLERTAKYFLIDRDGRHERVTIDRLIPAPTMVHLIGLDEGQPP